jgi:hypothetical protein
VYGAGLNVWREGWFAYSDISATDAKRRLTCHRHLPPLWWRSSTSTLPAPFQVHSMSDPLPPPLHGNIWQSAKAANAAPKQSAATLPQLETSSFGPAQQARLHAVLMRGYAPEVCTTSGHCAHTAVANFPRTQMSGSDANSAAGSAAAPAGSAESSAAGSAAAVNAAGGVGAPATLSDAQSLHSSDAPSTPMPTRKRKANQSVG